MYEIHICFGRRKMSEGEVRKSSKLMQYTYSPAAFFDAFIGMVPSSVILTPLVIALAITDLVCGLVQTVRVYHGIGERQQRKQ